MKELKITNEMINELFSVITKVRTEEECMELFEDLCTKQEIEKILWDIEIYKETIENAEDALEAAEQELEEALAAAAVGQGLF